jgi:hypothetical protein
MRSPLVPSTVLGEFQELVSFINHEMIGLYSPRAGANPGDGATIRFYLFDERVTQHIHEFKNASPIGQNFITDKSESCFTILYIKKVLNFESATLWLNLEIQVSHEHTSRASLA